MNLTAQVTSSWPEGLPRQVLAGPAPGVLAAALQLEIVADFADLTALAPEWETLFERAGRPMQVFQTHGFVDLYARTHDLACDEGGVCATENCGCRLAIVTARRDGRLVLVWPLLVRRQLGLKVVTWLGEPIAQYGDVLVDPSEPALPLLREAYAHLLAVVAPDVVRLRKVRADAVAAPFLAGIGIAPTEPAEAPCVTLAAGGSPFEDRQSGKARKNRRRLMRRLEEQGTVTFAALTDTPSVAGIVTEGLALKRQWLVRRGLVSPALADHRLDGFMTAAVGQASAATGGIAFVMQLDGRPIAVAIGFRCKRRLMLHLITHAAEVEKHGVGVLHLEAILRWAEVQGLEAVDLLPPKAEYKLDWADTAIAIGDYAWGVTPRGRLLVRLLDGVVRPRAKQTIERLPMSMRQRLAARTLRRVMA